MIYDNGWYRVIGIKQKHSHYFFNDQPLHVLKHGSLEEFDCSRRYIFETRKCKTCLIILDSYSDLENRCTTP